MGQKGRTTMRKYKYRGYTFFATPNYIYAKVRRFNSLREELRPVYHIEGLKDAATRPFLTSHQQCHDFIDCAIFAAKGGE